MEEVYCYGGKVHSSQAARTERITHRVIPVLFQDWGFLSILRKFTPEVSNGVLAPHSPLPVVRARIEQSDDVDASLDILPKYKDDVDVTDDT